MREMLILDDAAINQISNNQEIVKEFPFFRSVVTQQVTAGCGDCGKSANITSTISTFSSVKMAIMSLSKEKKKRLLELLRTRKIRMRLTVDNKVKDVTIFT